MNISGQQQRRTQTHLCLSLFQYCTYRTIVKMGNRRWGFNAGKRIAFKCQKIILRGIIIPSMK